MNKTPVKVGDTVRIRKGVRNWTSDMDKFIGKEVVVTNVQITGFLSKRHIIKFKENIKNQWNWVYEDGHFKVIDPATVPKTWFVDIRNFKSSKELEVFKVWFTEYYRASLRWDSEYYGAENGNWKSKNKVKIVEDNLFTPERVMKFVNKTFKDYWSIPNYKKSTSMMPNPSTWFVDIRTFKSEFDLSIFKTWYQNYYKIVLSWDSIYYGSEEGKWEAVDTEDEVSNLITTEQVMKFINYNANEKIVTKDINNNAMDNWAIDITDITNQASHVEIFKKWYNKKYNQNLTWDCRYYGVNSISELITDNWIGSYTKVYKLDSFLSYLKLIPPIIKVGDQIVIKRSNKGWTSQMDKYIGTYQIVTKVITNLVKTTIFFSGSSTYNWVYEYGHFEVLNSITDIKKNIRPIATKAVDSRLNFNLEIQTNNVKIDEVSSKFIHLLNFKL